MSRTHTPLPTMGSDSSTTPDYDYRNQYIDLQSTLRNELNALPEISPNRCIYRVPRHLHMANEGAYTPLVVSIGPLHHFDKHLLPTEIHKLNYFKSFLDRSCNTGRDLQGYIEFVQSHEGTIRGYYADPMVAQLDSEELIKMILVDAAFLIELFSRDSDNDLIKDDDQMFNHPRMVVEVSQDIRLEENQLPLFILEELYNAAGFNRPNGQNIPPSFLAIACKFLGIRVPPHQPEPYKHFLDLVRSNLLPTSPRVSMKTNGSKKSINIICKSATSLREAGVKFTANEDSAPPCGLLDIKFDPRTKTLSIPKLKVEDDTEALFKNLAVFEQCHYFDDSYIIDYITFMDFLINTKEDVALLVKKGILEHWLGSDERVADMFNGLSKHLRLRSDKFYYATQCKQLDEYYNQPCNHHLAVLRQKYFNHPWATISVVYAIVLLILTVVQAATGVVSILPSKKK